MISIKELLIYTIKAQEEILEKITNDTTDEHNEKVIIHIQKHIKELRTSLKTFDEDKSLTFDIDCQLNATAGMDIGEMAIVNALNFGEIFMPKMNQSIREGIAKRDMENNA